VPERISTTGWQEPRLGLGQERRRISAIHWRSSTTIIMRLRPVRSSTTKHNSFVRLHPKTVQALCQNVKSRYGGDGAAAAEEPSFGVRNGTTPTSSTDWTIASVIDPDSWRSSPPADDVVDFLPLQLTWWWDDGTNTVLFASYNGGRLLVDDGNHDGKQHIYWPMILSCKLLALSIIVVVVWGLGAGQ
jgi:hypothetical protein